LDEAKLILEEADLAAAAIYLTGYAVECILKSLLLASTPARTRKRMLSTLKDDFGHNLRRLRAGLVQRGIVPHREVARELIFVSSGLRTCGTSPEPGDRREAERFLKAATTIEFGPTEGCNMATILRGARDKAVRSVKAALDLYRAVSSGRHRNAVSPEFGVDSDPRD